MKSDRNASGAPKRKKSTDKTVKNTRKKARRAADLVTE